MKLFQSKVMCMGEKTLIAHPVRVIASSRYPNGYDDCYHDFIEIELIIKGSGIHHLNGIPFRVTDGLMYLLLPGDHHYYSLDEGTVFELYNIKIDAAFPSADVLQNLQAFSKPYAVHLEGEAYEEIKREVMQLVAYCEKNPVPDLLGRNLADRIILLLTGELDQREKGEGLKFSGPLQSVLDYISTHYRDNISSADMEKITGLSAHYFSSYFKKQTGLRFCDYVNRVRLFRAAERMENTTLYLKEISAEAGFSSQAYFTRMFTRFFGISPNQYRKRNERKGD